MPNSIINDGLAVIPKQIIQFCHNKSSLPTNLRVAVESTRSALPDYSHILVDDADIKSLLLDRGNMVLHDLYSRNKIPASRSDMARLIMVNHYGGIYVDLSFQLRVDLDRFLLHDLILVQRDDFPRYAANPRLAHCTNSLIGCKKDSPIIQYFLSKQTINLLSGRYNQDVINCTGPGIIKLFLDEFETSFDIHKLSFLKERGKTFSYVRVPGFSNTWKDLQIKGILRPNVETSLGLNPASSKTQHNVKTLHCHFGWPKVGSTSLQDFFCNHAQSTMSKGAYTYPLAGRPNHVRAHHQLIKFLLEKRMPPSFLKECEPYRDIIISSERGVFLSTNPDFLIALKSLSKELRGDIRIYLYLRKPVEFIESAYGQCLRSDLYELVEPRYADNIERFAAEALQSAQRHVFAYGAVLSSFLSAFSGEQLIVRSTDDLIPSRDVVADFIRITGLEHVIHLPPHIQNLSNRSSGWLQKYLMMKANKKGLNLEKRKSLLVELQGLESPFVPGSRYRFCNLVESSMIERINEIAAANWPDGFMTSLRDQLLQPKIINSRVVSDSEIEDFLSAEQAYRDAFLLV